MVKAAVDTVWPATDDDLPRTAALHVAELPHGLFPRLGRGYVRRWHRAHLRSPFGVVLVACDGIDVVGFLVGAVDQRANIAWIIAHHRTELVTSGGLALAVRPWLLASFVRTRSRRYVRRLRGSGGDGGAPGRAATIAPPERVAVLEAVVVAPPSQGAGVGGSLVAAFLATVAQAGVDRVELVTKAGPQGAGRFYERQGWRSVGTHVDRDGEQVRTYRIRTKALRAA